MSYVPQTLTYYTKMSPAKINLQSWCWTLLSSVHKSASKSFFLRFLKKFGCIFKHHLNVMNMMINYVMNGLIFLISWIWPAMFSWWSNTSLVALLGNEQSEVSPKCQKLRKFLFWFFNLDLPMNQKPQEFQIQFHSWW